MPFKARRPAGGFKIMYEYANRLCELGYSVHITYPLKTRFMKYRFPYWVRLVLSYIEGFRTNRWFNFHPAITMSYAKEITDKYVPDADVVIATWWATALDVGSLSESKGKKINLIQGYEDWEGHTDLLHSSYDMPGTVNVVVASYLLDIVKKYTSNKTVLIPNAIDSGQFHVVHPIEERKDTTVCMLYSAQEIKGSEYGLEALHLIKEKCPKLKADLFGIWPAPEGLPDWITYYRDYPDLSNIYNNNSIFMSNSLTEGFGLVSVEAMLCGCALVCTDIAGHKEYAIDGETALLVEPKNPVDMAEKMTYLINNGDERVRLAKQGYGYVQRFSWDSSVKKMDKLITQLLKKD